MLVHSTWSRPVKAWLHTENPPHHAEFPMINTSPHGVPIGGFGAGTIGIAPDGKWNVFHLEPGKHVFEENSPMGLTFEYVVEDKKHELDYNNSLYSASYPQAKWQFHVEKNSSLNVEQLTPVIPHHYEESSYPVGCFEIKARNNETKPIKILIHMNCEDILGATYKRVDVENTYFHQRERSSKEWTFTLEREAVLFSKENSRHDCEQFGVYSSVPLAEFKSSSNSAVLTYMLTLLPDEEKVIRLVVGWHLPALYFENNQVLYRKYTEFFPGRCPLLGLLKHVYSRFDNYKEQIEYWHNQFWNETPLPDSTKTLMLNELYYLAHGGTLWEAHTNRFGYLECIDYPFYETLDVRFYSSWALLYGWPELEKQVMRQFAKTIEEEDKTILEFHKSFIAHESVVSTPVNEQEFSAKLGYRKHKGACPHDLGSFRENPFLKVNAYCYQNPNYWKDLNPKFILMVYRDYFFTKDRSFLEACWPAVKEAYEYYKQFDKDNDGLPENEGWPDQTFDNWTMQGASAYCSLLWLAAQRAYLVMADDLGETLSRTTKLNIERGLDSLEKKLWNEYYYSFDEIHPDVMAGQLMGQWYVQMCQLPTLIDEEREKVILSALYNHNFVRFEQKMRGMVNGRTQDGFPVFTPQGNDSWLGVNYAVACHMMKVGLIDKAQALLLSIHDMLLSSGLYFRTPESIDKRGHFIAQMYMRPQAIWSLAFLPKPQG